MLAGDGAPHLDAKLEDFGAEALGFLSVTWLVGIEQNEGMQIAVASMKHIHAG